MMKSFVTTAFMIATLIFVGVGCSVTPEKKRVSELEKDVSEIKQLIQEDRKNTDDSAKQSLPEIKQPEEAVVVNPSAQLAKPIIKNPVVTKPVVVPIPAPITPPAPVTKPDVFVLCGGVSYKEGTPELFSCQQQAQAIILEQQKIDAQNKATNFINVLIQAATLAEKENTPTVDELIEQYKEAGVPLTTPSAIATAINDDTYRRRLRTYQTLVASLNTAIASSSNSYEREVYEQKVSYYNDKILLMQATGKIL